MAKRSPQTLSQLQQLRRQQVKRNARRRGLIGKRDLMVESLEDRMLLAIGPQLVGISPNEGELLRNNDVRSISPQEFVFRFDGNQIIDPSTLSGIQITRSGFDGTFGVASSLTDFGTLGTVVARFSAVTPGPSGNDIVIRMIPTDLGGPSDPIITVEGNVISVELNVSPGNETTALDLISAINLDPATSQLVQGSVVRGLAGTDIASTADLAPAIELGGANVAQAITDMGTGGELQLRLLAVLSGQSQNGIQVQFTHFNFGGPADPIVQTSGNTITVTLNTSVGSETLAEDVVAAINNHPLASQRISASVVVGDPTSNVAGPTMGLGPIILNGAADNRIVPGFIGVNPDAPSQVIVRFAETLPDDIYSIDILGNGPNALANVDGEAFNGETDLRIEFTLDLGARILAVVPQPVSRAEDGSQRQAKDQIVVYFNDDDLAPATAADPAFYQLIFTNHKDQFTGTFDTVTNTDDTIFSPTTVQYDADADTAVLTFASDINDLIGGTGTFRLRVGTDERFTVNGVESRLPPAPKRVTPDPPTLVTDLNTGGGVEITLVGRTDNGSNVRLNVFSSDLGLASGPAISVVGRTITVELNSNPANATTATQLVSALNARASHLLRATVTGGLGGVNVAAANPIFSSLILSGQGSSFDSATNLGELGVQSQIISSTINAQQYGLEFPGSIREPGHRDIATQQHYLSTPLRNPLAPVGDSIDGITTLPYNFKETIGRDPNGNVLFNLISEAQKERAREIFEIYASYLGVQFVETAATGFTIATGDLRALSPTITTGPGGVIGLAGSSIAIMDNAEQWDDTFGASDTSRTSWFDTAMHEIGHLLGLGHTDELAPFTVMNDSTGLRFDNEAEDIFPGDNDLVHGLYLYRPESKDVDLYRFEVTQTGQLTAETFAERLTNSSLLDTVLNLYQQNEDGSRKLMSSNDDYYSEDSFLRMNLSPGTYFVGVSASGNAQYDPTRDDSGFGGTSQGDYDLRLFFRPTVDVTIVDTTGTAIDGDADGVPGGAFNFWFRVGDTHFVDKAADGTGNGTISSPFTQIDTALAAATPGDIVRVIGNAGADGDMQTLRDNIAYEVGFDSFGRALEDGTLVNVPKGVTLVIDAGSIFKMRRSAVSVGSTAIEIDRSGGALQVLGTPKNNVFFTSYNDESIGVDTDRLPQTPRAGDWGGIVLRNDLDRSEARFDYERQGIFLDVINQANIRYGGANVTIDSVEQTFTPIHLIDSRPTISYNTIRNSAKAAISANPDSFEETNFHSPKFQSIPFTAGYDRVGPDIHGNTLFSNTVNGLFLRIDTPAGNAIEQLTVSGRWDDTDIVHTVSENLEILGTPGGPTGSTALRKARLDASLVIDPGLVVKLDGAGIEVELGAQLIAEGLPGREIVFTSVMDDRYGAGSTFDTSNNNASTNARAGDWTGLYWSPVSQGSLDHVILAYAGGVTKIEGTFAGFNAVEIHQAKVRIANSKLENNANGLGGQSRRNRFGQGRNAGGAIYVLGAQPILLNNTILNTISGTGGTGPAININANSLNSDLVYDYGRSTGNVDLETRYRDNQGPLIRDNVLGANDLNGMLVRGATLTTESVWDDTDIVHVLTETIYVPNFHTFGGLRLESSPTESLVVKLAGDNAGFTATGTQLDIDDRIGGSIQIIGQPGRPVVLTSLSDGSVGAGIAPDGSPQFNTSNEVVPGRTLPAGSFKIDLNFGPEIILNQSVVDSLRRAVTIWESIIQDPITVVLDVEFGDTDPQVLGFATPEVYRGDYDEIRGEIINDAGSHEAIVTSIPTFSELRTTLPTGSGIAVIPQIDIARANALALGIDPTLLPQTPSQFQPAETLDGNIIITNRSNTPGADVFDTALHEIGHALGFISAVGAVDDGDQIIALSPMDLFRVAPGEGATNFRNTPRVLDPSRDQVFYDGGIFNPAGIPIGRIGLGDIPLSTGVNSGDGYQASHWKNQSLINGINIGNMSPTGGGFTSQDRRAFDLIGYDIVTTGISGEWRSIRLEEFSNDRNVEVITELEPPAAAERNGNTFQAEFLGSLASTLKSGDENLRLGFEVHGFLSHASDVDVYSFRAKAQTEVWIDIDLTTQSLDTVVELIDVAGRVIASSDNSLTEADSVRLTDPATGQVPGGTARPMQKSDFYLGDLYSTNVADAGMRVVLPGGLNTTNTYHVRVRSASNNGGAFGVYQMQVRLQETDEVPGSTIRYADIRFATNGIEVLGLPGHSPLLGEIGEVFAGRAEINDTFATAQPVGNVLQQDRGTLSISGFLNSAADVDWYRFEATTTETQSPGDFASLIFDVDYADGLARPNTSMWIFDSSGSLVLFNRDGQIKDDVPTPNNGDDLANLSRGSAGLLDPFIGPVSLPVGSYYLAISTSAMMPDVLAEASLRDSTLSSLRLEPLDVLTRAAEDHLGDAINPLTNDESTTNEPLTVPSLFSSVFSITAPAGFKIRDGETFSTTIINADGTSTATIYEFDSNGLTIPGHTPVAFRPIDPAPVVAGSIAAATRGAAAASVVTLSGIADLGVPVDSAVFASEPSAVPFFLGDLVLYVSAAGGVDNSSLYMVDPFTGARETVVGGFSDFSGDIALRKFAGVTPQLFTFSTADAGNTINDTTTSYYMEVDWVTGAATKDDDLVTGLVTFFDNAMPPADPMDPPPEPAPEPADVGYVINAMAYVGAESDQLYAFGSRGDNALGVGNEYWDNIMFQFDPGSGAAISDGMTRAEMGEFEFEGGGFDIREQGRIDTMANGGPGGKITGLANLNGTFFAVSDQGGLWRVAGLGGGDGTISATLITTVVDDAGGPIRFGGLTTPPAAVESGAYNRFMFGVATNGDIVAMDNMGVLQPIFVDGTKVVRSRVGGATGLAFGTLEQNLWAISGNRGGDAGHGVTDRVTGTTTNSGGGSSFHFEGRNIANPAIQYPGGSHGTIVSNTFDLSHVGADDEPFVYFNYFSDTQDSNGDNGLDAIRVYVSDDNADVSKGEWRLLATNNNFQRELDLKLDANELYDTGVWRQARVSLKDFVGSNSLRLRFDFATAGDIGLGSLGAGFSNEGEELRAVDAKNIQNGQIAVIGGRQFVMNFGYMMTLPSGGRLVDGETFSIDDGSGNSFVFEFDNDGQTLGVNEPIPFSASQSAASVARAVQAAIIGRGVAVAPHLDGNRVNLSGAVSVTQIHGASSGQPVVYIVGGEPPLSTTAIQVPLNLSMTASQVKYAIVKALADTFAGGNQRVIKHYGDVIKIVGRQVSDSGPFGLTKRLAPEALRAGAYGQDAASIPAGPARRAQENNFEGIYIDDVVIGFASRGELVSGATPTIDFVADPSNPDNQIERGNYLVEIRRAPEYTNADAAIFRSFDPNSRFSESNSIHVSRGVDISPGQTFEIGNGISTTTYEFVDQTLLEGDNTIATANPTGILAGSDATFRGIGTIGDNIVLGDNTDVNTFALDVDLLKLDVSVGDRISFDVNALRDTEGVASTLLAAIRVFDETGAELASDVAAFGNDPFLVFDVIRGMGSIYVGVSRAPNVAYDPRIEPTVPGTQTPRVPTGGNYEIIVTMNGGEPQDANGRVTVGFATFDDEPAIAKRVVTAVNRIGGDVAAGLTGGGQVDLFGDTVTVDSPTAVGRSTSVSSVSLAAVEPNDVTQTAVVTGIEPGESVKVYVKGEIGDNIASGNASSDVDLFQVNLAAGDTLHVEALLGELNSGLLAMVFVQDQLGLLLTSNTGQLDPPVTSALVPASERDPELVFVAPANGSYWVGIRSQFGTTGPYELVLTANGANKVERFTLFGDTNADRDQGQLIIHSNIIRNALQYGINIDAGTLTGTGGAPHMGPTRVTREVNDDGFTTGVVVLNNIVAGSGTGAIRYSGAVNPDNQTIAAGAVPFGRILNNTIYGNGCGTGLLIENSASPTILNNIVANTCTAISVDASSSTTVIGGMLLQGNVSNGSAPNGLGDFLLALGPNEPLFVDANNGNYYLDFGSRAIDSSVDSLEDRPELVTIRTPLGIPLSPILAPSRDVTGQLRVDDPDVDSPAGVGGDVFKDRGALERADFVGLSAVLLNPIDNDANGLDLNPATTVVQTFGVIDRFSIQLVEGTSAADPSEGTGTDDLSVNGGRVSVTANNVLLTEGVDYRFEYDPTNNVIRLRPIAGIWPGDRTYIVTLDNSDTSGIRDLANNPLRANQSTGESQFTIILGGNIDFGDAPDTYGTLLESDGARHEFRNGFFLGQSVDSEQDGQPSAGANLDLDDGVHFPNEVRAGYDVPITVTASASGLLDAWIDLNADGDWDDAGEQIFVNQELVAGANDLVVPLPLGSDVGETYARFRFSSAGNLTPTGLATDGEVEDYRLNILDTGMDFGDAPDGPYATIASSDGARHQIMPGFYLGQGVTPDVDARSSAAADGDADDGVRFDTPLVAGGTASITVTASQAGTLDAWIDLNGDGDWADANEYIFAGEPLDAGENSLSFPVNTTATGPTFARFRLTASGINSPTGLAPSGEVEDYRVSIVQPILDFGDAPSAYPVLLADDGARHVLTPGFFLGNAVDQEVNGQPSTDATGDGADEDGIRFPEQMFSGTTATITVTSTATGLVDAWIDFNQDGDWDDAGEQILTSEPVVAGINMVDIPIASNARTGLAYARFRFSSVGGLSPIGQAPDGEVEDYEISLLASSWHNANNPTDVNDIAGTTPLDALLVINELNDRLVSDPVTGRLIIPSNPPPFYDVDNNGIVSPFDALTVINNIPTSVQAPLAAAAGLPGLRNDVQVATGLRVADDPTTAIVVPSDLNPLGDSTIVGMSIGITIWDDASVDAIRTDDLLVPSGLSAPSDTTKHRNVDNVARRASSHQQLHDIAMRTLQRDKRSSDRAVSELVDQRLRASHPERDDEETLDDLFSNWL